MESSIHLKLTEEKIEYGTAGFRTKGTKLDHILYRMGILSVLRSKLKLATIGVMITASHNPEEDNGVKLIDPDGEMLSSDWELIATKLANISNENLESMIDSIVDNCKINISSPSYVLLAYDTRSTSIPLSLSLIDGIKKMGSEYNNYGILTTPQLHYMVKCNNSKGLYGKDTLEGYYEKLSKAFISLNSKETSKKNYKPTLYIDGANGVGALHLKSLLKYIDSIINITIFNKDISGGKLNQMCGADFVKVQQKAPSDHPSDLLSSGINLRCASFDGDADRIVYYFIDSDNKFHLLDGDKIAVLIADYLSEIILKTKLSFNIGVVQTAYANGASTDYIKEVLKLGVECVPTGVKHLHHKAQQLDIGIYFEANGHGTVLYKNSVISKIKELHSSTKELNIQEECSKLLSFINLTNQTIGDAISDMLIVETILNHKDWNINKWNDIYTDLPNRQLKVKINDRNLIQTTNAEREVTKPEKLQSAINDIASRFNKGRSFVRPSGTEDIVRVYAEADTQKNADQLAYEVSCVVYDMAFGTGERPLPL